MMMMIDDRISPSLPRR